MRITHRHAGFTLVETILALGIAGLIIGGIWMAYSTASHVKNQAIEEQQIGDLLQMARNYMAQYNENDTNIYGTSNGGWGYSPGIRTVITDRFVTNNLVPGSVQPHHRSSPDEGNNYDFLLASSTNAAVGIIPSSGNPYGSGPLVFLGLYNYSKQDCEDILSSWAGSPDRIQSSGLIAVVQTPYGTWLYPTETEQYNLLTRNGTISTLTSLQTNDIQTACTNGATLIVMAFRLVP